MRHPPVVHDTSEIAGPTNSFPEGCHRRPSCFFRFRPTAAATPLRRRIGNSQAAWKAKQHPGGLCPQTVA
ncbi:hypothetical protein PMIN01_07325 [Paraphaeosphaeria minitans]|uniref:Uncharacterized protein n=1 Tax=Paraphaeosphaeria minitans TaxID=565426 RepID=A0A9P6KPT9_9PLEO|nr:hypothetical protein PMIN01_07325 [Paraphaeosphaeria minitans]